MSTEDELIRLLKRSTFEEVTAALEVAWRLGLNILETYKRHGWTRREYMEEDLRRQKTRRRLS